MNWKLIRIADSSIHTFGYLIADDLNHRFHSLELPWRNNAVGRSRIPEGEYKCRLRATTKKPNPCFEVCGVPNRRAILLHIGNTPSEIRGCILLGDKFGELKGEPAVLNSRKTFKKFHKIMEGQEEFTLKIVDAI